MAANGLSKLQLKHLIPQFELNTASGEKISLWDFKGLKPLIIVFVRSDDPNDWEITSKITKRYDEIISAGGQVIIIASGKIEEINRLRYALNPNMPILLDTDKTIWDVYGANVDRVFVCDRYGELKMISEFGNDFDSTLNKAIIAVELSELECPECGIPTWE